MKFHRKRVTVIQKMKINFIICWFALHCFRLQAVTTLHDITTHKPELKDKITLPQYPDTYHIYTDYW